MMRILIITNELLPVCGVTKSVSLLIQGLEKELECECILMCGNYSPLVDLSHLKSQIVERKFLKHQSRNYFNYLVSTIYIFYFVKKYKVDIIHSHHHYLASIAQVVKKITKIGTIQTNHGIIPEVGRLNHFSADYIVAVNEHAYNYISRKIRKKNQRVFLIRYGYSGFLFEKKYNDPLHFIAASRLVKDKGLDLFIKAVSILPLAVRQKAKFFIAGVGEIEQELRQLNKEYKADIVFLGYVPQLLNYLTTTDIFVLPSRSTMEGFPTVVIEAGLALNLIITSDFNGRKFVLEENIDGFVFNINDYFDLSKKMERAVENFEEDKKLANNFLQKVIKLFDYKKMINLTADLYITLYSKIYP